MNIHPTDLARATPTAVTSTIALLVRASLGSPMSAAMASSVVLSSGRWEAERNIDGPSGAEYDTTDAVRCATGSRQARSRQDKVHKGSRPRVGPVL